MRDTIVDCTSDVAPVVPVHQVDHAGVPVLVVALEEHEPAFGEAKVENAKVDVVPRPVVECVEVLYHAQSALGDLVYVELPEVGQDVEAGGEMAVVESVKAASDVYAPVGGEVVAVNEDLSDDPEKVNADPYGDGWIVRVKPSGDSETMSPDEYQAFLDDLED